MAERVFTSKELAHYLQISRRTLARWRAQGTGPAWSKAGRGVRYRGEDIEAWLQRHRREVGRPVARSEDFKISTQ